MKKLIVLILLILTFVNMAFAEGIIISNSEEIPVLSMANPASVYCCINHDYTCEIRTNDNGNQYGMCIFDDGKECEEWSFYFGRCGQKYSEDKNHLTGIKGARWSLINNFVSNSNQGLLNAIDKLN